MVIFNSYVKLPEGMLKAKFWGLITDGLIHFLRGYLINHRIQVKRRNMLR